MTATEPASADLQHARAAFRDARHALAAAVLAGNDTATVASAWRLLRTHDRLKRLWRHPSGRDNRTMRRWRRFALEALRSDPPSAGLIDRVRVLFPTMPATNGAVDARVGSDSAA